MSWLTVTEYPCHKWLRICSICRKYFPVLNSFMIYHRNWSNTTGAICGAGTAYTYGVPELSPGSLIGFVLLDLEFSVFCFVDHCLSFWFWPLCCLSFYLWILITPLVSSNSSYIVCSPRAWEIRSSQRLSKALMSTSLLHGAEFRGRYW